MSLEARTNLRVFAIIGVSGERPTDPRDLVTVRKVVYTREAADASVDKLNADADGRHYFWQLTSIEPLG